MAVGATLYQQLVDETVNALLEKAGVETLASGAPESLAIETARSVLISPAPLDPTPGLDDLPPLYEADDEGGWTFRGADYSRVACMAWVRREMERCRELAYFVEHYAYTVNLHLEDKASGHPTIELVPSGQSSITGKPWVHIRAVLEQLQDPQDIVVEKSRDMMASWLVMATVLHDVLFRKQWAVMTLSRVESLVDDGGEACTPDSLHGKVRFIYDHLPGFLREAAPLKFKYLAIRNPLLDSHVTGYSATVSPGRGAKYKRAILDEFAWVPHSHQVMFSVGPACPVGKVLVSTPHGKGNAFYDLRERAASVWPKQDDKKAAWKKITVHWSQHPERDEEWYRRQCETMTAEAIAQELDLNYARALGGRVYPAFVHDKHVAGGVLCRLSDVTYDPQRPLIITCDWNYDPLIWELGQQYPDAPRFRMVGEICRRSAVIDDALREFAIRFASKAMRERLLSEQPEWETDYGRGGIGVAGDAGHTQPVIIYGDATEEKSTVHNRVKTYQGMRQALRNFGFDVQLKVPKSNPPRQHRFETLNYALTHNEIAVALTCEELRKDFESGVWNGQRTDMDQTTEDSDGSGLTRSHSSSATGYWLCQVYKPYSSTTAISRAQNRPAVTYMPDYVRRW